MQELDANTAPRAGSPLGKSSASATPSPSKIHKQYWDGVAKRAAAAKPPKSPLAPSNGSRTVPETSSPRRGGAKVPAKSPLQGVAASLVKGAHDNPLFADAQHTPKAAGWRSIAKPEHASKENSAPPNASPQTNEAPGKSAPKPAPKPPASSAAVPSTDQGPAPLTTVPVNLTPNQVKPAINTPPKADTVIDIAANQEVKNRVDYALNTPPNTPATDPCETANLALEYPNAVRDNPEYSPSNNVFSPRPEFRRPSLARGATPGRAPLAAEPDWSSLLSSKTPPESPEPKTPPRLTPLTSVSLGGSPRYIEVLLQEPGSERATPRRRLRMSPDDDEDDGIACEGDVIPGLDDASSPHPVKSRVRLLLKLLLATVVFLALGGLGMEPGRLPWELRDATVMGRWAPRGLWHGTPGAGTYNGDVWFSNNLFVSNVDWPSSVKKFIPRSTTEEEAFKELAIESSPEETASFEAGTQLPIIRLSFDEYDGPHNLDELVSEGESPSSASFTEPDPDVGEPDERADVSTSDSAGRLLHEADVTRAAELPGAEAAVLCAGETDERADVSASDDREADVTRAAGLLDTRIAESDAGVITWDAVSDAADASPSVYERQVREAALLEMADLAVRSYASAFAAALALFALFSLAAFVATHFLPAATAGAGGRNDVSAADNDITQERDDVTPAEVTTPMFLRQGVRMEEPVVVAPVESALGSPFGRYQAFVRHIIGQNTESPQLVLTPVQRSRRLADKFRSVAGSPSRRFTISPA